jgi:hypothetical protein
MSSSDLQHLIEAFDHASSARDNYWREKNNSEGQHAHACELVREAEIAIGKFVSPKTKSLMLSLRDGRHAVIRWCEGFDGAHIEIYSTDGSLLRTS